MKRDDLDGLGDHRGDRARRRRRRPDFRTILLLAMGIGISALSVTSAVMISGRTAATVEHTLVAQGTNLVARLADQSRLALLVASPENVQDAVEAALSFPDVLGVAVYDERGRALLALGETGRPVGRRLARAELVREDPGRWEFAAPVVSAETEEDAMFMPGADEPRYLGHVVVTVSKATLRGMVRDIRATHFTIAAGLGLVLMVVLWWVTARVTKPLRHLAEAMRRAGRGDFSVRARMRGPPDVEEMERAFNQMVKALERRTRQLEAARDAAMELARLKGEFVANVSHEIRTPLNGIIGMLELLRDMGLSKRQREYVNVALGSSESLLGLINDILDFSRVEAGRLQLERTEYDPVRTVEEVITLYSRQAQKKGIDLATVVDADVPRMVVGDQARVRQVLMNFVSNAVKFTHRGEVGVYLRVVEEDGSRRLRVEVRDTGIGIGDQARARIFEPFVQADGSTTRRYGGSGLGLAICHDLVEAMGGRIGVESTPGEGSTFWFELPLEEAVAEGVRAEGSLEGLRVLVADDEDVSRAMMEEVIVRHGGDCVVVERAAAVIPAIEEAEACGRSFDVVVVDERLGGQPTVELLQRLARHPLRRRPGVVAVGYGGHDEVEKSADLLLTKPLRREDFRRALSVVSGREESVAGEAAQSGTVRIPRNRRILVVEDNRANQQVAVGMLERLGCRVDVAANGLDAVEAVTRRQYDLVLMDCQMPEMDGFDATRRIRVLENGRQRIPIIAMTAHAAAEDGSRCIEAGMDGVLVKPLRMDTLRQVLAQWLGGAGQEGEETDAAAPAALDGGRLAELRAELGPGYRRMIEVFLEDTPEQLTALADALEGGDRDGAAALAHGLKGAALNLGGERMAELARRVEEHVRDADLERAISLLEPLRLEFEAVAAMLQQELGDEAASPETEPPEAQRNEPARVLVVDDDRALRETLRRVLEQDGYRVEEAADGAQALALCERQLPDLVLLDAVMPVMDGFAACARIRQLPGGALMPVLIVTALEDEHSIERAFAAGASDYVSKPVHLGVLRQRVSRLLDAARAEQHVRHLAFHDSLTGLPNRAMFVEQLREAITRQRGRGGYVAVLFLDLDRFKIVNDTLGHDIGDLLLKAVAERLQGCVRGGDVVARLGGDEFTVILDGVPSREVAAGVARKILDTLARPFVFLEREMYVSASIGISMFPDDGEDVGTLVKRADTAMFRAKEAGAGLQFYEAGMEDAVSARLTLEGELRMALERDELVPYYQPIVDATSGEVVGAEALVRWRHPRRGLVPPGEFIALAEETGLVLRLGERMLRLACAQARAWADAGRPVRVAVNLSGLQFEREDLPELVRRVVEESGLDPRWLGVEITEGTLMRRPEAAMQVVRALRALGVGVAIDDFGTGYSSLAYLKRFDVDVLKIDRSFVRDLPGEGNDAALVEGIVALGHSLGICVAAEGVETEPQRAFLQRAGCDLLQGFLIARPLPARRFTSDVLGLPAEPQVSAPG